MNLIRVATNPATQFTAALVQNEAAFLSYQPDMSIGGIPSARAILRGLTIVSVQNLNWEVSLWGRSVAAAAPIDSNSFIGLWGFTQPMAHQIGALYYYYVDGLQIGYIDEDGLGQFHLGLVNRSISSKLAGAAGAIKLSLAWDIGSGF